MPMCLYRGHCTAVLDRAVGFSSTVLSSGPLTCRQLLPCHYTIALHQQCLHSARMQGAQQADTLLAVNKCSYVCGWVCASR